MKLIVDLLRRVWQLGRPASGTHAVQPNPGGDRSSMADFVRILTEPEHALPKQAADLLAADGVDIVFTEDGLAEIARAAAEVNANLENIGARRLHTILETVVEEISFAGPDASGARIVIDRPYVERALEELVRNRDLSRFVL